LIAVSSVRPAIAIARSYDFGSLSARAALVALLSIDYVENLPVDFDCPVDRTFASRQHRATTQDLLAGTSLNMLSFPKIADRANLAAFGVLTLFSLFSLIVTADETTEIAADPILKVTGEVEQALELKLSDLAAMPRKSVSAIDHGNVKGQFEGVTLYEILKKAGAPVGDKLRGQAMELVVVISASDGYRASFGIAELDPAFTDNVVIVADTRDGKPMDSDQGPLRIIVPHEKKHGRWVRMVERITVFLPPVDAKPAR
jgi:hypothetical protein